VRWQDLNAGSWQKMKERSFTFICTLIAIVLVAVIVNLANEASAVGAAFTISAFSTVFPIMAKMLTDVEAHPSEGSKQSSLYFKICFFRWVSTSVVISLITPFTSTLTNKSGLITQVYALFFADIVTTNALQLLDPFGHIARHYQAPRASTQDSMNLLFQGTVYELAERYTDMTKVNEILFCLSHIINLFSFFLFHVKDYVPMPMVQCDFPRGFLPMQLFTTDQVLCRSLQLDAHMEKGTTVR
jgi:hypothetical protein